MNSFSVAVLSIPEEAQEQHEFLQILNLACAWLGNAWRLTETGQADSLILVVNSEQAAQALWQHWRKIFPAERIIVYGSGPLPSDARWSIAKSTRNAPSVLSIVNVLLGVQAWMHKPCPPVGGYEPQHYLQGILQEALADGISRACSLAPFPDVRLYILPKENACYILEDIQRTIPLCLASRDSIHVDKISDEELLRKAGYVTFSARLSKYTSAFGVDLLQDIAYKKSKRYSMREMLWFATLVNSQGRLLAGHDQEVRVLLKHWPEFIRLQYYKDYLDSAKRMSIEALCLPDAAVQSQLPQRQVIDFYNACTALSLTVQGHAAEQEAQQYQAARAQLCRVFKPYAAASKNRLKLVVTGSVGAGKSTTISTLSDFAPVMTETRPTDAVSQQKSGTTVAMDYGEIRFDDFKLFLYGTPGQKRFEFMGEILLNAAWGLVILIDNSAANPIEDLTYYLQLHRAKLGKLKVMVGITQGLTAASPPVRTYRDTLAEYGVDAFVSAVDPRDYRSLAQFFSDALESRIPQPSPASVMNPIEPRFALRWAANL